MNFNNNLESYKNKKDLVEVPKDIRERMTFFPVKDMDEVVKIAFRLNNEKKSRK